MKPSDIVIVAETMDPVEAGMWVNALGEGGIEARSFERGEGAALGGAVTAAFARYPVVVRRDDLARARSIIADHDGAASLVPVRQKADERAAQNQALITVGLIVGTVAALAVLTKLIAG